MQNDGSTEIDTPAVMHSLMPLKLAAGLAPEIPLAPDDCICAGNLWDGKIGIDIRDMLDGDRRLVERVRAHLLNRGRLVESTRKESE